MADEWMEPRQPTPFHLRGEIAEIWESTERVGLLYRWDLSSRDGEWIATARKYRLGLCSGSGLALRFFHSSAAGEVELRGEEGQIFTGYEQDESVHKAPITIKGLRLEVIQ